MQNNIAFLVAYFGKLPSYFNAFLSSVANKHFDVFFFSDCDKPMNLPSNIKWYSYSFTDITKLIRQQLDQNVMLRAPYKLCDFKPALGLIFKDYIKEYAFWGSIDIDLCVGDFDKYLSYSVLDNFDVFSGIKEYLSGSMFIVRNDEYYNNIFKKSKDWQTVFLNERYLGFDECGGQYFKQLKSGKTFDEINPPIESFTEVLFKEPREKTRIMFKNVIAEPKKATTLVDADKIVYENQEYLLVHYIFYKAWYSFYTDKEVKFPFYINRLGFFQHKPNYIRIIFSENFRNAFKKKVTININKLKKHF